MKSLTPFPQDSLSSRRDIYESFRENGYLFVRDLLPRETLLSLRGTIIKPFVERSIIDKDGYFSKSANMPLFDTVRMSVLRGIFAEVAFHQICHHASLLQILSAILGSNKLFLHPRRFLRVIPPVTLKSEGTTPPHQDYRYVQGSVDTITTWLPLGDYQKADGGLMLQPRSHRDGLLATERRAGAPLEHAITDVSIFDWATSDYRVGDVLLFHSCTVHGGMQNHSEKARISIDFRYQDACQPIASSSLLAPFEPSDGVDSKTPSAWCPDPFSNYGLLPQIVKSEPLDNVHFQSSSRIIP